MKIEHGAVYVQTNDGEQKEIVAFRRTAEGRLQQAGAVATGGRGSGKAHLASQGSVVLHNGWVLVVNASSDDVSILATDGATLTPVDRVASGGSTPTSIAVHGRLAYVLNTGDEPNVTGFEIGEDGRLVRLGGGTRPLGVGSDPAQVAFSPDRRTLVVTDRAQDSIHAFALDESGPYWGRCHVSVERRHAVRVRLPSGRNARRHGGGRRRDRPGIRVLVRPWRARAASADRRAGRQHSQ